ncbi:MAG: AAA family ATPase [Steroidobacterales bacterium]
MSQSIREVGQTFERELGQVVIGVEPVIHALTIAVIARGHVLLQGAPGLGKTLLSKALARCLGGSFQRIQGTADLMPSDIIGVHVYDSSKNQFVFRPGPLFADVVLMDEINRAGPKTQSAVLEAMEERQVTVERARLALPDKFVVIATQNPREFEGTYPLPESQLDRFMLRIELAYPARASEAAIIDRYGAHMGDFDVAQVPLAQLPATLFDAARAEAQGIHVSPELVGYMLDVARATREHPQISLGLSTRGLLALTRAARVEAALRGSDFATPDDVKAVAGLVAAHRLVLTPEAALEGTGQAALIGKILEQVAVPR